MSVILRIDVDLDELIDRSIDEGNRSRNELRVHAYMHEAVRIPKYA